MVLERRTEPRLILNETWRPETKRKEGGGNGTAWHSAVVGVTHRMRTSP